jgi:hypothetical protein
MSDPENASDPRLEEQDGAVRDVDAPEVQQDTVSGGAPDEPDADEKPGGAGTSPEDSAS